MWEAFGWPCHYSYSTPAGSGNVKYVVVWALRAERRRDSIHFGLIDIMSLPLVTPECPYPICDILRSAIINLVHEGAWPYIFGVVLGSGRGGHEAYPDSDSWLKANENPKCHKHWAFILQKQNENSFRLQFAGFRRPYAHRLTVRQPHTTHTHTHIIYKYMYLFVRMCELWERVRVCVCV